MDIYIAASSRDVKTADALMQHARAEGHTITHDWTPNVYKYGRGQQGLVPGQVMKDAAYLDREGVRDCDLFILLWSDYLLGGLIELGIALELDTPVWIVKTGLTAPRFSVFYLMPDNHAEMKSWTEAIEDLGDLDLS